jgi:hypothetical protein
MSRVLTRLDAVSPEANLGHQKEQLAVSGFSATFARGLTGGWYSTKDARASSQFLNFKGSRDLSRASLYLASSKARLSVALGVAPTELQAQSDIGEWRSHRVPLEGAGYE